MIVSIIDNVNLGLQTIVSALFPTAINLHSVFGYISDFSDYLSKFFGFMDLPEWLDNFMVSLLSFSLLLKICHL